MAEVEERYWSGAEDEDTFTGHLGALLGTSERKIMVSERPWRWSIEYTKFRGRGKDATERSVGADGIFEIRVHGIEFEGQKSLLFQSKMGDPHGSEPREQAIRLSNWREAAVFLSYTPAAIKVYSIDDVLGNGGATGTAFADFFLDEYLACNVGDSDLHYDAKARTLRWRDEQGNSVAARFPVPRRLRISIQSPDTPQTSATLIRPEQISEHRMDGSARDRLGVKPHVSADVIKKAKRKIALLYHPDRFPNLADELKAVINRRMAEFNVAYQELIRDRGAKH
ncbi:MAG TPA: J domain-containing protein [Acidobacteriaceae bacterium]|jgi:hypothetical protein